MLKRPPLREASTDPQQPPPEDHARAIVGVLRQMNVKIDVAISAEAVHNRFIGQAGEPEWLAGLRIARERRWIKQSGRQLTLTRAGASVY
jgi:hypothetical protein